MMEHVCPDSIAALFDDDATIEDGRQQAVDWLLSIEMKDGDRVWLPEVG